jgi:hypothetical protein
MGRIGLQVPNPIDPSLGTREQNTLGGGGFVPPVDGNWILKFETKGSNYIPLSHFF